MNITVLDGHIVGQMCKVMLESEETLIALMINELIVSLLICNVCNAGELQNKYINKLMDVTCTWVTIESITANPVFFALFFPRFFS